MEEGWGMKGGGLCRGRGGGGGGGGGGEGKERKGGVISPHSSCPHFSMLA